jgi:hypothetical protein
VVAGLKGSGQNVELLDDFKRDINNDDEEDI